MRKRILGNRVRQVGAALAFAACAASSHAQEGGAGALDQKFWLQLGAFDANVTSHVRAASTNGSIPGTDIDLEDELGLARHRAVGNLLLGARLNDRWRFEFEYFRLQRSASQPILGGNLQFGDTTYPVSVVLSSEFDSQVYRASAGYSLYRTPEAEFGAVLGLHVTDFDVMLSGTGTVGTASASTSVERRSASVPLPTVGLYGARALGDNWLLGGRVDVFSLNHRGYNGRLVNAQLNLAYRITRNVALGLGYRIDDYRLSAQRANWTGDLHYVFRGPQVLLQIGF